MPGRVGVHTGAKAGKTSIKAKQQGAQGRKGAAAGDNPKSRAQGKKAKKATAKKTVAKK